MKAKSIIPQFTCYDIENTIDWLCKAFGFEKHVVISHEDGKVSHVELVLDNCMVMFGSAHAGSELSEFIKHPSDVNGKVTQSPYIILDDKDIKQHYAQAKKCGAKIVAELREEDYGGQHYSCYDIEGHLWSFGTYDPWATNR